MKTIEELKQLRSDFSKGSLSIDELHLDPFQQFNNWIDEAESSEVLEPIATTLSTVSKNGQPSSRVVYIRGIENDGLIFFTNYHSKKGQDMKSNSKACMNLFWPELERQIQIQGTIEKVSTDVSDLYFANRPTASKIGAWASQQSSVLIDRKELEDRILHFTQKFENIEIPRPKNWGGYKLKANLFEFWQGRKNRLHDRFRYEKNETNWKIVRLNP